MSPEANTTEAAATNSGGLSCSLDNSTIGTIDAYHASAPGV